MGLEETLKKYEWIMPLLQMADRQTRSIIMKNFRNKKKNYFPEGEFKANVEDLIKCMLCPNMCRFDCGTLQAEQKETMSPSYKARIGYYISMGKIDPMKTENKPFIDLMYKCTNEESCKVWCPFDFSVVSLLETVRDDLNDKGLMPKYCKQQLDKLHKTNTIEDHNIFLTYREKGIENIETDGNDEVYYYIGCEMMKFPEVVKGNIEILKKLNIKFSTNLDHRACCGGPAFNIRDFGTAKDFAQKNKDLAEKTRAKLIVSDCPGCVLTLTKKYKTAGIDINAKIIHIVEYFAQLIKDGRLKPMNKLSDELLKVTIHDPCLIARNLNDTTSIRTILKNIPDMEVFEPIYNKENVHCCGWSGTAHWADKDLAIKEAINRIKELKETGSRVIVSACPLCEIGLGYGITGDDKEKTKILDISELLAKSL
jgi:fumarate reductase (CoM/CoB) subunit B